MYFIVRKGREERHPEQYTNRNPEFKKSYGETVDKLGELPLRQMAKIRRDTIRQMRFQGKTPELIAKSKAIRQTMERRINDL